MTFDLFLRSSFSAACSFSILFSGHLFSQACKNSRPFNHVDLFNNSTAVKPRVTQSAGLSCVGTYLHCSGLPFV